MPHIRQYPSAYPIFGNEHQHDQRQRQKIGKNRPCGQRRQKKEQGGSQRHRGEKKGPGDRDLPCTAWGNPTYNVKGWKGPCYLITDAHYKTFEDLMTKTPWESYGHGNDPRCEHCMVHCGDEPSAALGINAKLADSFKMLTWALR